MPVGLTLLILLSIFLLFRFGGSISESLQLSRLALLGFCAGWVVAFFVPPYMAAPDAGINIAMLAVSLFFMFFLLFRTDSFRFFARTVSAGLVTGALLLGLTYLIPPQPQGYIYQPYILYGLIGGILAFVLARTTSGVAVAATLGLLLLDLSVVTLGSSPQGHILCSGTFLNALMTALFVGCTPAVLFAYYKNRRTKLVRVPMKKRPQFNFEAGKDMQLRISTIRKNEAEKKEAAAKQKDDSIDK